MFSPMRAAAMLGFIAVSGCGTTTIEEAVPQAALEPANIIGEAPDPEGEASNSVAVDSAANTLSANGETAGSGEAASSRGPKNTGVYPNLNEVQRGALAQMTPAEKQAYLDRLSAARAGQNAAGAGESSDATKARLRALARSHDEETLRQIESQREENDDDE